MLGTGLEIHICIKSGANLVVKFSGKCGVSVKCKTKPIAWNGLLHCQGNNVA